jgi:metal-responsive CopG/Arc/MetJ family transcriptional regulator
VCHTVAIRLHITLSETVVRELDRRVGPRGRSAFIAGAVEQALEDERRWELIESALGSILDKGHDWDEDAAEWVRSQRRGDERRVG